MAFCKNCGQQIADLAVVCPHCGVAQQPATQPEGSGFGWGVLGCCVPLVGLILFLCWKQTKPNSAKAAGIGALISVGLNILLTVITMVAGMAA